MRDPAQMTTEALRTHIREGELRLASLHQAQVRGQEEGRQEESARLQAQIDELTAELEKLKSERVTRPY